MTRYPVDKVLAKIAQAQKENPFGDDHASEMALIGRNGAFELCKMWIEHFILTEQFDEESEAQDA